MTTPPINKPPSFSKSILDVGDEIIIDDGTWGFGNDVAEKFTTHVRRSIPYYEAGHQLVSNLSDYFVQKDSVCYELGCSVGELILKLAQHHTSKKQVQWIGIDLEAAMIQRATATTDIPHNVNFVQDDINLYTFEKSDFIAAYYVMHFISPRLRQALFDKIYATLNWGGAFLLFEKVRGPDARFQDILTGLYHDYKLDNHYTSEEIIAKSKSLKGILEPFSTQGNLDLLSRAGFVDITTVMKYLCFEGFLAIK